MVLPATNTTEELIGNDQKLFFTIRNFSSKKIAFALTLLTILFICGLPIFNLFKLSLRKFDLSFFNQSLLKPIFNTISIATGTTIFSIILGTILAFFVTR